MQKKCIFMQKVLQFSGKCCIIPLPTGNKIERIKTMNKNIAKRIVKLVEKMDAAKEELREILENGLREMLDAARERLDAAEEYQDEHPDSKRAEERVEKAQENFDAIEEEYNQVEDFISSLDDNVDSYSLPDAVTCLF